jgi:hypothetical protein
MLVTARPRAARALLALALGLALLGPGGAGRAAAVADRSRWSLLAGPAAGPEQGLVRDRPVRPLVTPGGTRDDRERPGPAAPVAVALAVAAAWVVAAAALAVRPAGPTAATAGARAPPPLQPASV